MTAVQDGARATEAPEVAAALARRRRFILVSHARPDGDSIGSQLALAFALRALGKQVRVVGRDPAPRYLQPFPGVRDIEIATAIEDPADAVVVLECGTPERTELEGLDNYFLVNIDHHVGNTRYGDLNWIDETRAACGEMVFDIIANLGVPLSREIATHVYVAILTDTGGFRHSSITDRTFEIACRTAAAGVSPASVADRVFQQGSTGKLRLTGHLLSNMALAGEGRVAVLAVDDLALQQAGCAEDDLDGLINLPLAARDVSAVVMFKHLRGETRVSLRSKGAIDVRAVARRYGGGGHHNAAGLSLDRAGPEGRDPVVAAVVEVVRAARARA